MSSVIPFLDESEAQFSEHDVIRARTMVNKIKNCVFLRLSNICFHFFLDHGKS